MLKAIRKAATVSTFLATQLAFGQAGSADLTGTVKGDAIHFTFTLDVQGQQAPVTYDGTVEKNTMKGKMDIAGMVNGTFTATKK